MTITQALERGITILVRPSSAHYHIEIEETSGEIELIFRINDGSMTWRETYIAASNTYDDYVEYLCHH